MTDPTNVTIDDHVLPLLEKQAKQAGMSPEEFVNVFLHTHLGQDTVHWMTSEEADRLKSLKDRNSHAYMDAFSNKLSEITHTPVEIFAEVSNACNLNCVICVMHNRPWPENGIMPWATMEKIIPFLDKSLMLHAFGFGEPLVNVNQPRLLVAAKKLGVWIDFFTNGMLLDAQRAKLFVDIGVDKITVSVDGGTKETFEYIREKGNWEKLNSNLKFLRSYRMSMNRSKPYIIINFVCTQRNIIELPLLVQLAADWGVAVIDLKPLVTYAGQPQTYDLKKYYEPEIDDPILEQVAQLAAERSISINFTEYKLSTKPIENLSNESTEKLETPQDDPPTDTLHEEQTVAAIDEVVLAPIPNKPMDTMPCFQPFKVMYIKSDGDVKPCCFYGAAPYLGNINEMTIEEIWFGDAYANIRNAVVNGQVPEGCQHCYKFDLRPVYDDTMGMLNEVSKALDTK